MSGYGQHRRQRLKMKTWPYRSVIEELIQDRVLQNEEKFQLKSDGFMILAIKVTIAVC